MTISSKRRQRALSTSSGWFDVATTRDSPSHVLKELQHGSRHPTQLAMITGLGSLLAENIEFVEEQHARHLLGEPDDSLDIAGRLAEE